MTRVNHAEKNMSGIIFQFKIKHFCEAKVDLIPEGPFSSFFPSERNIDSVHASLHFVWHVFQGGRF